MNAWQAVQQLKFKLLTRTWPDAPSNPVLQTVLATQGATSDLVDAFSPPMAIVSVLDQDADAQSPEHKRQRFEVALAVAHRGDRAGEFALVGAQRNGPGRSAGRGLLEVEEQLLEVVNALNRTNAMQIQCVAASAAEAGVEDARGYVCARRYTLEARLTTARKYQEANGGKKLTVVVAGATVTLSWAIAERFDFHATYSVPALTVRGGHVLRRAAGATPPATVTDGTGVTLSGAFATSVADTPGVGTWSYSLFAKYEEFAGDTTNVRHSDPVYAKSVVVV